MNDCMTFPDTVEEFMEQYKVVDTEHIYTNGTEFVPIFRMKQWFKHLPSIQPDTTTHDSIHAETGKNDTDKTTCDCISRQTAIDAICEDGTWLERQGCVDITMAERKQRDVDIISNLPSIQPKGTRLSTVCLLCKKPAVTFNTEDDIPYTNYSYCEDCLRKGLKLLREQNKNLQTQPERETGRWIYGESEVGNDGYYCSECGNFVPWIYEESVMNFIREYKFCPNCGADMKGDKYETD